MSAIILSAAHFLICACRHHGQIITGGGDRGEHSVTKRQARRALFAFVESGKVSPDEIPEAERQIDDSPLPSASDELEQHAVDIVNGTHGLYDPDQDVPFLPGEAAPEKHILQ